MVHTTQSRWTGTLKSTTPSRIFLEPAMSDVVLKTEIKEFPVR
ncbi:unnamed protein product, partial [marine sediment metagenome]